MLSLSNSMADSLVAAHLDMHTRFPVTARTGDPQGIVGYVNFKDIVAQLRLSPHEPSLRGILRPLTSLADSLPIASCLERMIREHTHIALVRESSEKVLGMITLEDIIEELVGEIHDEYDRLPAHVLASGSAWVVGGGTTIPALQELTGINLTADLPRADVRTLSEWVAGHLGRPVRGGDLIQRNRLRVLVRKVRRQQVLEAQITPRRERRMASGIGATAKQLSACPRPEQCGEAVFRNELADDHCQTGGRAVDLQRTAGQQWECPQTMMSWMPKPTTANSIVAPLPPFAAPYGGARLPAFRMMNSSPGSVWVTKLGLMRESEQVVNRASGCWPSARHSK